MASILPNEELHKQLDAYILDPTCSTPDLQRLLDARHEKDDHILNYNDELEERFDIMRDIQDHLGDTGADEKEMTRIAASLCLTMPMDKLRSLTNYNEALLMFNAHLGDMETNVIFYQTGKLKIPRAEREAQVGTKRKSSSRAGESWHSRKRTTSGHSLPPEEDFEEERGEKSALEGEQSLSSHRSTRSGTLGSSQIPTHINRSAVERRNCLERDPNCIWTGSSHVEACHVIPFSLHSDTRKKQQIRKSLDGLLAYLGDQKLLSDLVYSTESPDKAWNMLTLSKTLHWAWSQAEVAFKFDGQQYDNVKKNTHLQLRIFFLNVRKWKPNDKFKLNQQNVTEMAMGRFLPEPASGKRLYRDKDGTQIMSGHKIEVILPRSDADKLKELIQLQWHYLNIAAMSGAATAFALARPEDFEPPEPEPELHAMKPVLRAMKSPSQSEVFEGIKQWIDSSVATSQAPEEQPLPEPLPEERGSEYDHHHDEHGD